MQQFLDISGLNSGLNSELNRWQPESIEQLIEGVQQRHHDRQAMVPTGNGSKLNWGGLVQTALPIEQVSLGRLDQLIDHAAGDLTVTVQAGMKLTQLQEIVGKAGQFLAIDPSFADQATIGGIVATGDSGALRHRYNSVRDMVLGLEFVRSDGQLVKVGGRVVKNVAGYDLMKLLTGSYGTLGILTQVTLRLYPHQEASQTILLTGETAVIKTAIQTVLNSGLTPTAMDLISAETIAVLGLTSESSSNLGLLIQVQGLRESVQEQCDRLVELGKTLALTTQIPSDDIPADSITKQSQLWRQLADCMTPDQTILCKWAVRPNETATVLSKIQEQFPKTLARLHCKSGLGQLTLPGSTSAVELKNLRSLYESKGGFLTILSAPTEIKQSLEVWGLRGNGALWMRSIQQQFDPHSLLSPNRMKPEGVTT